MYHIYFHNKYLCSARAGRIDDLLRDIERHFSVVHGHFFSDSGDVESGPHPTEYNLYNRKGNRRRPWFPAQASQAWARADAMEADYLEEVKRPHV